MSEIVVEEFYKRQAKDLTNLLFDKGFLANDLTRESIDWLEDYLGFIIQSQCQMAEKGALLLKSIRGKQVPHLTKRAPDNGNVSEVEEVSE